MVVHRTQLELNAAYNSLVGRMGYAEFPLAVDSDLALAQASLQTGQSVLEIGAGSGRLTALAKRAVGPSFCAAVDAIQGFLTVDIPWALQRAGLTVHPQGPVAGQVHLMHANVTDPGLRERIFALPGAPQQGFDCIFAVHLLNTVPADQRRDLLRVLRRLLAPTGRLIVTMSARFTDVPPSPDETAVPVQFRTTSHTEAPGAMVLVQADTTPTTPVPLGLPLPRRRVQFAVQMVPDRFFAISAHQARAAAEDVGFLVQGSFPTGDGKRFGLAVAHRSAPQAHLDALSVSAITAAQNQLNFLHGHNCVGRAYDTVSRRRYAYLSPSDRDHAHVMDLQFKTMVWSQAVRTQSAEGRLPAGVIAQLLAPQQLGTLVVLGKN